MGAFEIQLNGQPHPVESGYTLNELIDRLDLAGKSLAVSINREVIKRSDWPTRRIMQADRIEIVHAIGGG